MKRSRHGVWIAALLVVAVGAFRGDGAEPPAGAATVATVGPLRITRAELAERERLAFDDYRRRAGSEVPAELRPSLRRQALEALIRSKLLLLESQRLRVPVSDAEAENLIKQEPIFNPNGTFSPRAFENARQNSPEAFRAAMAQARLEIGGRKLSEQMQRRALPDEARLRAAAERSQTRSPLDYLALHHAEFDGRAEPREADVIAHYRAHAEEYRRPARAVLRVLPIPGGPAARPRADSALAAIRGGASFREVAAAFEGSRDRVVVQSDNFPGYWRGTDRMNETLFRQPAETLFPEPVPSSDGWLVVWVQEASPAAVVPLSEVSREIRESLREQLRRVDEEKHVVELYQQMRDSLSRPAFRVRYAVIDTSRVDPGRTTEQELLRWYRSHQAEFTRYDAARGAIEVTPFEQVRDEVERRWRLERRLTMSRALAERIERAWREGSRDRAAENSAGGAKEAGPVPHGGIVDGTPAGRALGTALGAEPFGRRTGITPFARGVIVYHVHDLVDRLVPTFEQVREEITALWRERKQEQAQREARRMFEENPNQLVRTNTVYFSRLIVENPPAMDVPLTRGEVEAWHRDHFDEYSAAEQVRARHILLTPRDGSVAADAEARRRAEELLARARGGEDFADLAKRYSDDEATREQGGDLGYFPRGVLLDAVEKAAFSLPVGGISDPVRTEEGYHLVRVLDHLPLLAEPLKLIYGNVGYDAAIRKAERISRRRADSVFALVRTPDDARRLASLPGFRVEHSRHVIGDRRYPTDQIAMVEKLEKLPKGRLYPNVEFVRGQGAAILWVDSIAPPRRDWNQVAQFVLPNYFRMIGRGTLDAKRAELDSLFEAGWSLDSLGALWGGLASDSDYVRGRGLPKLGGTAIVDSVVLGTERTPPIPENQPSGWIELPEAIVRLRVRQREKPSPFRISSRMEADRRLLLEYALQDEYKAMRQRFPVQILDAELREVPLPKLPPMPQL